MKRRHPQHRDLVWLTDRPTWTADAQDNTTMEDGADAWNATLPWPAWRSATLSVRSPSSTGTRTDKDGCITLASQAPTRWNSTLPQYNLSAPQPALRPLHRDLHETPRCTRSRHARSRRACTHPRRTNPPASSSSTCSCASPTRPTCSCSCARLPPTRRRACARPSVLGARLVFEGRAHARGHPWRPSRIRFLMSLSVAHRGRVALRSCPTHVCGLRRSV